MDFVARAFRGVGFREVRLLREASDLEGRRRLAARTAGCRAPRSRRLVSAGAMLAVR